MHEYMNGAYLGVCVTHADFPERLRQIVNVDAAVRIAIQFLEESLQTFLVRERQFVHILDGRRLLFGCGGGGTAAGGFRIS